MTTITPHLTTLPNGLRVIAVEMPHLNSAEIAVYLKVGGRHDSRDKAGLAHFLEHMIFRGNAEHPSSLELEADFEAIGGCINAATDAETTCYYTRVHPNHVAEGLRLLSVMLLSPALSGIEIEKKIITEEALEDINEQGEEVNSDNLASRLLWPGHGIGMPTIGYLDTIAGFTEEDLRGHMARHYVPGNAVVVAAGQISPDEVFTAVSHAFAGWSGSSPPCQEPVSENQEAPGALFVKDSDSQVSLQIAFRSFPRQDGRLAAARLMRRILTGGGCSRLHLSLRERLGIVYSVDAQLAAYDDTGCFAIELATAPENLSVAVAEVLHETLRLATEPVGDNELERVRQGYFFDLDYSRDSTFEMQVRYGWGELMGMMRSIEEDQAEAGAVDAAAVMATARELFLPARLNLVAVGPVKAAVKREIAGIIKRYEAEFRKIPFETQSN